MSDIPPRHPHVPKLPREYRGGAFDMKAGDRVRYKIDGRTGVADEFLSDGDAFVVWDDDTIETVKWNHLEPVV